LRRGCELVKDFALVAEAPALDDGPAALKTHGTLSVTLTDKQHYGAALLFATGSLPHLEALQALARDQGLTLSPRGLKRGRKLIASRSEEDIYRQLGLPFIPPELREGRGEIARAGRPGARARDG
jgi:DNA polymerase (family 10)